MLSLTIDPSALFAPSTGSALGPDASHIREHLYHAPPSTSMLVDERRREAQAALIEQFIEAAEQNHDGYWGAIPSFDTLFLAWNSLARIPSELPVPDVTIHPDGEIAFERRGPDASILTATL